MRIRLNGKNLNGLILGFDTNVEGSILQSLRFLLSSQNETGWDLQWIPLFNVLIAADRGQRNIDVAHQVHVLSIDLLGFASFRFSVDFTSQGGTTCSVE